MLGYLTEQMTDRWMSLTMCLTTLFYNIASVVIAATDVPDDDEDDYDDEC